MIVGNDIVREAFAIRTEILELAPDISSNREDQPPFNVIMPFYYCGLVSVSRFFIDPLWLLASESLPVLSEDTIQSHCHTALAHIERRFGAVYLESVFYLPILSAISLEMQDLTCRKRILKLFQIAQERGFAVASTFCSDIKLAWTALAFYKLIPPVPE